MISAVDQIAIVRRWRRVAWSRSQAGNLAILPVALEEDAVGWKVDAVGWKVDALEADGPRSAPKQSLGPGGGRLRRRGRRGRGRRRRCRARRGRRRGSRGGELSKEDEAGDGTAKAVPSSVYAQGPIEESLSVRSVRGLFRRLRTPTRHSSNHRANRFVHAAHGLGARAPGAAFKR